MSTSNRKEVLAAGRIVAQGAARSRKKLPACGRKKKFLRMHYFWAVLYGGAIHGVSVFCGLVMSH